jgi:hypothetical protein
MRFSPLAVSSSPDSGLSVLNADLTISREKIVSAVTQISLDFQVTVI